jgi:hypothetical protein
MRGGVGVAVCGACAERVVQKQRSKRVHVTMVMVMVVVVLVVAVRTPE